MNLISSKKQRRAWQNYHYNRWLEQSLDDDFLVNQYQLSGWKYGICTSDYTGCGWIAVVNLLRLLGETPSPAAVICQLEQQPWYSGLFLRGKGGTLPWAPYCYIKQQYPVKWAASRSAKHQLAERCRAGIVFYLTPTRGHFIAFAPTATKGEYHFYNDIAGAREDIRPLDDVLFGKRVLLSRVIGVVSPD